MNLMQLITLIQQCDRNISYAQTQAGVQKATQELIKVLQDETFTKHAEALLKITTSFANKTLEENSTELQNAKKELNAYIRGADYKGGTLITAIKELISIQEIIDKTMARVNEIHTKIRNNKNIPDKIKGLEAAVVLLQKTLELNIILKNPFFKNQIQVKIDHLQGLKLEQEIRQELSAKKANLKECERLLKILDGLPAQWSKFYSQLQLYLHINNMKMVFDRLIKLAGDKTTKPETIVDAINLVLQNIDNIPSKKEKQTIIEDSIKITESLPEEGIKLYIKAQLLFREGKSNEGFVCMAAIAKINTACPAIKNLAANTLQRNLSRMDSDVADSLGLQERSTSSKPALTRTASSIQLGNIETLYNEAKQAWLRQTQTPEQILELFGAAIKQAGSYNDDDYLGESESFIIKSLLWQAFIYFTLKNNTATLRCIYEAENLAASSLDSKMFKMVADMAYKLSLDVPSNEKNSFNSVAEDLYVKLQKLPKEKAEQYIKEIKKTMNELYAEGLVTNPNITNGTFATTTATTNHSSSSSSSESTSSTSSSISPSLQQQQQKEEMQKKDDSSTPTTVSASASSSYPTGSALKFARTILSTTTILPPPPPITLAPLPLPLPSSTSASTTALPETANSEQQLQQRRFIFVPLDPKTMALFTQKSQQPQQKFVFFPSKEEEQVKVTNATLSTISSTTINPTSNSDDNTTGIGQSKSATVTISATPSSVVSTPHLPPTTFSLTSSATLFQPLLPSSTSTATSSPATDNKATNQEKQKETEKDKPDIGRSLDW